MKKTDKFRKKIENTKAGQVIRHPTWIVIALISCFLLVGILAKYIYQTVTDPGQITSEYFYFTTNLLGDTTMVATDGTAQESYSFTDQSTEGTWYLYGASEHKITIQVQNFFDDLRIDEKAITFEGNVSAVDASGTSLLAANNGNYPKLKLNDTAFTSGTIDGKGQKASTELTLDIPACTDWNYTDGTVVTAKISSTAPYKKTLTMKFILYTTDINLKYKVIDSVGSPYAELIIMTNVDGEIQPYIKWNEALSIDNTNPLTFSYSSGTFTQMDGIEARNMQVSEKLGSGRSESIYFFKNDTSKDYSQGETIVNPDSESKYVIKVGVK